jgi:O-antigen ligase
MLKIAKLVLYGVAGILTARALARPASRGAFHWSLLGAGIVSSVALMLTGSGWGDSENTGQGFTTANGISVMMAILFAYVGGRILARQGSRAWTVAASASLVVLTFGWVLSDGRGGWVAAAASVVYLLFRLGLTRQMLYFAIAGAAIVVYMYQSQPVFQKQVDMTIFPTEEYGLMTPNTEGPIDDGYRFQIWTNQAAKFWGAPVLGSGIWHRGAESTLWTTGSHNFWLQMYLEAGIVGGTLAIAVLVIMWRHAGQLKAALGYRSDIPLKAAIVAAAVGGLSEAYFYGGIVLFALLAVYAPTGSMPLAIGSLQKPAVMRGRDTTGSTPEPLVAA